MDSKLKEKYDVVYRRIGGVGVAVIRRNEEDILSWLPQQNFSGEDGSPISRKQCPDAWKVADVLSSTHLLVYLARKEARTLAKMFARDCQKIPRGFTSLKIDEHNLLLFWVYQCMKEEHLRGVKAGINFKHEDSHVSHVFEMLRWEDDGTEDEIWGGYKKGKEIIKKLCIKAGMKEFTK